MTTRTLPEKFLVAFSFAGEQRDLVRSIAEKVEQQLGKGTVFFDEWFDYYIAGVDADLKLQRIFGEICELAVVCVSGRYGDQPWPQAEHEAIRARLMKLRVSKDQRERDAILPIRVGDGDIAGIPFTAIAPDVRDKEPDETAKMIVDRLRHVYPGFETISLASASPDTCWPETPPDLRWPMADQGGVREAFATLLTAATPWRFLPVRGSIETGKSLITQQMLANALNMSNLACGRFDFKGGTDMDAEVRSFVLELGVLQPPKRKRLAEQLRHILNGLQERKMLTLLIFDTYEAAGKFEQDWAQKELLTKLVRASWLRVVIAGQRVPERSGAVWEPVASKTLEVVEPSANEWHDYGKQHNPDLKLNFVEEVWRMAKKKPSVLGQIFGSPPEN